MICTPKVRCFLGGCISNRLFLVCFSSKPAKDIKKASQLRLAFRGSPNWARTSDIMINSHALYRLSYGGITAKHPIGCLAYVGVFLFFQIVTNQVSSALLSLTSVFGMGTGGPSASSIPTLYFVFCCRSLDCLIIIARCFRKCKCFFKKILKNLKFFSRFSRKPVFMRF